MTENTSQPAAEFKADFNDLNYFKNIYHQEYIRTAHQSGKKYRSLNGAVQRAVVERPCSAPKLINSPATDRAN